MLFSNTTPTVNVDLTLSDGTKASFKIKALTTKDQIYIDSIRPKHDNATIVENVEHISQAMRLLMVCEDTIKDKVIDDAYNNGDVGSLYIEMMGAIAKAKEKK